MIPLPRCHRSPNEMCGVVDFLKSWDDANSIENIRTFELFKTSAGSINQNGVEGSFKAPSLSPHHAIFLKSLEPGIAPLVLALIERGLVTYTSCEGHLIRDVVHEAHVGLIDDSRGRKVVDTPILKACRESGLSLYQHRLLDTDSRSVFNTLELYVDYISYDSFEEYKRAVCCVVELACSKLKAVSLSH